jgi:hypothetical protein
MVRNLERLILANLVLNIDGLAAVTRSEGSEFHGGTTRLEKVYLEKLVLADGIASLSG